MKNIKNKIKSLNSYLELKNNEINKLKENINSLKSTKDEYLNTKVCIEEKISKLSKKENISEDNILHIKTLRDNLDTYTNDILLLTLEIISLNEFLEDLQFDYRMVQKEIFLLEMA